MRYSDIDAVRGYAEKSKDTQQNYFSRRTDKLKDFDLLEGAETMGIFFYKLFVQ